MSDHRSAGFQPAVPPTSSRLRGALRLAYAILREIFDENAYTRFLERSGSERSRESYEQFLREMQTRQERRARCC